jgi:hypothetical protein
MALRSNRYLQPNKYSRDYLDHDRDDLTPTAPSPVPKLLLRAVVAGGAFALASRSGLLDALGERVLPRIMAGIEGAGRYWKTRAPGTGRLFTHALDEWGAFRSSYGESLAKRMPERDGMLLPHSGLFEDLFRQKGNLLKKTLPNQWNDAIRQRTLMQNLSGMQPEFTSFVNRLSTETLNNVEQHELGNLAVNNGFHFAKPELDALFREIEPLQNSRFKADEFFDKLKKDTNNLLVDRIKVRLTPKNNWMSFMTGARPATVSEVLASNGISTGTRNFLEDRMRADKTLGGLIYDPNVLYRRGHVHDWRSWNEGYRKMLEWWEPTMPGRLMHIRDISERGEAPFFQVLKRGTVHPVVTGDNQPLLENMLYAGGKIAPVARPTQVMAGEYEMVNAQYGLAPRIMKHLANIGVTARQGNRWYDQGVLGRVRQALDIGNATSPTLLSRARGFWTKFGDPDWYRNVVEGAVRPNDTFDAATVENLNRFFHATTPSPSERALRIFAEMGCYGSEVNQQGRVVQRSLVNFDDSLRWLRDIAAPRDYKGQLKALYHYSQKAPDILEKQLQLLAGNQRLSSFGDGLPAIFEDKIHGTLNGRDIINREISKEISNRFGYDHATKLLESAFRNGQLTRKEFITARQIVNASAFEDAAQRFNLNDQERQGAIDRVRKLFRSETIPGFSDSTLNWAKVNYPLTSSKVGSGISTEELLGMGGPGEYSVQDRSTFGQRFTPVKKGTGFIDAISSIKKQNDWTKARAIYNEATAGRGNLKDVTYNMIRPLAPYHLLWRMSEELNEFGLGFSGRSTGSFGSLAAGFALKRFLPVTAGLGALQYASWEVGNLTGYNLSQRWARTVARTHLMLAPSNQRAAHQRHIAAMYPYLDQMEYWPVKGAPAIGNFFSHLFFGVGTSQPMSKSDLQYYYANGNQPMRKGRYWAIGSRSPWWGDKTSLYYPNNYLMAMSDWQDSSTSLPGRIRWSHSWLPTPRYPLAPLNRIMQPYYWEQYHYNDRPYPVTGPAFEETTPWGPALNETVGKLIKPQRYMHQKELATELNGANIPGAIAPARAVERGIPGARQIAAINNHIKAMAVMRGGTVVPETYIPYGPYLNPKVVPNTYIQQMVPVYGPGAFPFTAVHGTGVHIPVPASQRTLAYRIWNWIGRSGGTVPSGRGYGVWGQTGFQLDVARQPGGTGHQSFWGWLGEILGIVPTAESASNIHADWARMTAAQQLRTQNALIKARGEFTSSFGRQTQYAAPFPFMNQSSIGYAAGYSAFSAKELGGIYGFLGETMLGNPLQRKSILQSANRAYSMEHQWWDDANMGGLGGMISEIGRRFLPHRMHYMTEVNPIRNTMPAWLPGGDYFTNFHQGDLYQKTPYGEVRLPGEGYERTHQLHPDVYGKYGAVDRFMILADVAPYSTETRYWRDVVSHMNLRPDVRHEVAMAKKREAATKRQHTFYPYHFQINQKDLVHERVHITRALDYGLFMTKEHPDNPIHIAGIAVQGMNASKISGVLGHSATIIYDKNNPIQNDTYGSIRAAVFHGDQSLARQLVNSGRAKEALTDWSPAGVVARYTPAQIHKAAMFEHIAHLDTPLNTKFLQVRSPLESYIREQVYGEPFGDWGSPWKSWIVPTYQSFIARNPIVAKVSGAAVGYFIGNMFFGGRGKAGAVIGGMVTTAGSVWREVYEHTNHKKWIPGRVRQIRNLDEYFDVLNYIKWHGLYEAAIKKAPRVPKMILQSKKDLESRKLLSKQLLQQKRTNYLAGNGDLNKGINKARNLLQMNAVHFQDITKQEAAALYYYQRMHSTLYGFEPGQPYTSIMSALPKRDREYFTAFSKVTNPKEQEKILALVPDNERRVYESMWHMPVDKQIPLKQYFKNRKLPAPSWPGWRPDIDLADVKTKVVINEARDMYAYDVWPNDMQRIRQQPNLPGISNPMKQSKSYQQHLHDLMQGMGFTNVNVQWTPGANLDFEIKLQQDRTQEMQDYLKNNLGSYITG